MIANVNAQGYYNIDPNCGLGTASKSLNTKIVGGQTANKDEWGWQVRLTGSGYLCGGTLVNNIWIITAGHCVEGLSQTAWTIQLGQLTQTRTSVRVILHPNFNTRTFKNDIALIKMNSPVTFSSSILPACIPTGQEDYSSRIGWATGYG
jgi:secreted trypsin-like serine protease